MAASAGPEIERLISLLAKLPGLGPRSARRAALALLKKREQLLVPLAASLAETAARVTSCSVCGACWRWAVAAAATCTTGCAWVPNRSASRAWNC